jgi:hypothetical protein
MSWLDALFRAYQVHEQRAQQRRELHQPVTPSGGICRRCGCDTNTCRDEGCIDQGEPMDEKRLHGWGDADACRTNYENRRYG